MDVASMREINAHPFRGCDGVAVWNSDSQRGSFVLRRPNQRVIVPPRAVVQKAASGHQKGESLLERLTQRRRK